MTIGYDDLKTATDWADSSEAKSPEEWAPAEGLDPAEMMKWATEETERFTLSVGPLIAAVALMAPEHCGDAAKAMVITAMIEGARIMNLVHRSKNPDLSSI